MTAIVSHGVQWLIHALIWMTFCYIPKKFFKARVCNYIPLFYMNAITNWWPNSDASLVNFY